VDSVIGLTINLDDETLQVRYHVAVLHTLSCHVERYKPIAKEWVG
jgi:hypothetical protein